MVKREVTEEGEVRTKRILFLTGGRDQGGDYSRQRKIPDCHNLVVCLCHLMKIAGSGMRA
jgi:hypothetical protein